MARQPASAATAVLYDLPTPHMLQTSWLKDVLSAIDSTLAENAEAGVANGQTPVQHSAAVNLRRSIRDWLKLVALPADPDRSDKEVAADVKTSPVAIVQVNVGYAVQGDGQPVKICLQPVTDWLPQLQQAIAQINAEIRDRVPLVGTSRNAKPLEELDAASLYSLADVVAARTQEQVQLHILPQDEPVRVKR